MAGPGDEIARGAAGRSQLRASHADREQAIDVLKAAFVQGRLAKDEFDTRVGRVFASRTYSELDALTADLPAAPAPSEPARKPVSKKAVVLGACVVVMVMVLLVSAFSGGPAGGGAAGIMVFFLLCTMAGVASKMLDARQPNRSGGQLPPGSAHGAGWQASQPPAVAAPAEQLPWNNPGHHPASSRPAPAARRRPAPATTGYRMYPA